MTRRQDISVGQNRRMFESTKNPVRIAAHWMRRRWLFLVASLVHYAASIGCIMILVMEGLDQALGEDNFHAANWVVELAYWLAKILLLPIGYLIYFNGSLAIGLLAFNSLIVCCSPLWIRWLLQRNRTAQQAADGKTPEAHQPLP
jgi:hypothetical protein